MLRKRKKTYLSKYGVENPTQSRKIRNKIIKTNLIKYGVENPAQSEIVQRKRVKTCIENGLYHKIPTIKDLSKLKRFSTYSRHVWLWTYFYLTESMNARRNYNRHIDHNFSTKEGFELGIHPKIIGHRCNLRIISRSKNCSKRQRCDIKLKDLRQRYESMKILTDCAKGIFT